MSLLRFRRLNIPFTVLCLGLAYTVIWYNFDAASDLLSHSFGPRFNDQSHVAQKNIPVAVPLPAEYLQKSKDQQMCENWHGEGYLRYVAGHHQAHCTEHSPSQIHSFEPPMKPRSMDDYGSGFQDHSVMWVLEGTTIFNAKQLADKSASRHFNTHCVPPPNYGLDSKVTVNNTRTSSEWDFRSAFMDGCSTTENNGQWIILLQGDNREQIKNIWHKLAEVFEAKVSIDVLRIAINPSTGRAWLSDEDVARLRIVVQDDRTDPCEFAYV